MGGVWRSGDGKVIGGYGAVRKSAGGRDGMKRAVDSGLGWGWSASGGGRARHECAERD